MAAAAALGDHTRFPDQGILSSIWREPVGLAALDAVIQSLFAELQAICQASDEDFEGHFEHLHQRLFMHCREEDELMLKTGYPDAQEHIKDHRRLLDQMEDLSSLVMSGAIRRARMILQNQLIYRFALHVRRFGPDLARFLKAR